MRFIEREMGMKVLGYNPIGLYKYHFNTKKK